MLLTPSSFERIDESDDWFRREIEAALRTQRNIIPLMLEGFDFDVNLSRQLPASIADITRYNALRVPVEYFEQAMARLVERFLKVPVEDVIHPLPPVPPKAREAQAAAATAAIHFFSCFISFSFKDEDFVRRLRED